MEHYESRQHHEGEPRGRLRSGPYRAVVGGSHTPLDCDIARTFAAFLVDSAGPGLREKALGWYIAGELGRACSCISSLELAIRRQDRESMAHATQALDELATKVHGLLDLYEEAR